MATMSITTNDGALDSASAVLEVAATNPEYNQPALRIKQAGTHGGAASIRIDDPNPDIELVETDQVAPAGKYEIAVQSDKLQINGRNADDTGFETILVVQRLAAGGNIGFRTRSQFGAGGGVIAIANATVAPTESPTDGGILWVENGALKYRGSNGTVTVIAPA
jgi:Fe-S cluster assembly iron-binding protein IscA